MLSRWGWHTQTGILLTLATLVVSAIAAQMNENARYVPMYGSRPKGWNFEAVLNVFVFLASLGIVPAVLAFAIASIRPNSRICQAIAAFVPPGLAVALAHPFIAWVSGSYASGWRATFVLFGLCAFFYGLALIGRPSLWASQDLPRSRQLSPR